MLETAARSGRASRSVGGELAQQLEHAVGPVTTTSASGQGGLLVGGGAHQQRRQALLAQGATASNASRSPRSSPAKRNAAGRPARDEGLARRGPCPCRRARTSITLRPGSTTRPCRARELAQQRQQPVEAPRAGRRAAGCARRRPGPSPRRRPRRRRPAQQAGQLALEGGRARAGGRGETTRRWVEVQRSLPYWPKTKSSLPRSPIASPTSSSPPRASAWRAGRPVTTATARTTSASSTSTSGASGWMCGLARGRRRSARGCRRSRGRPRPGPAAATRAA